MIWNSESDKQTFINFTKILLTHDDTYSKNSTNIVQLSLPFAYSCPDPTSCLGGLHSSCANGHHGPLCAVCIPRYYKLLTRCLECPSVPWLVSQLVLVTVIVCGLIVVTVRERKKSTNGGRSSSDAFFARMKIVIGFYQVTSATLDGFSYIQWPVEIIKVVSYAKMIQLNIFQIAPVHCFKQSFQVDAYDRLTAALAINGGVLISAFLWYKLKLWRIKQDPDMSSTEKLYNGLQEKERCLRITFIFLFIIYSATSSAIFQVLPPACQEICSGSDQRNCIEYLKYDYSIKCSSEKYRRYKPVFYLLAGYPLVLPLATILLLGKSFSKGSGNKKNKETVKNGLRFLYENYNEQCWFWEIVDIARKIILMSAIVLANNESRMYLIFLSISSGLYTVLFASYKPIDNAFEYWLQMASLTSSWANLMVGMLLKIPQNDVTTINSEFDSIGVTFLMVFTNAFVIGLIIGK